MAQFLRFVEIVFFTMLVETVSCELELKLKKKKVNSSTVYLFIVSKIKHIILRGKCLNSI